MKSIDSLIGQAKKLLADLEALKAEKAEADRQTADLVRYLERKADKRSGGVPALHAVATPQPVACS